MIIKQRAQAGTLESSDVVVMILPHPQSGLEIRIKSIVFQQFGKQIRNVAEATLQRLGVESCILILEDKGALDYTIRARIESAVERSIC